MNYERLTARKLINSKLIQQLSTLNTQLSTNKAPSWVLYLFLVHVFHMFLADIKNAFKEHNQQLLIALTDFLHPLYGYDMNHICTVKDSAKSRTLALF